MLKKLFMLVIILLCLACFNELLAQCAMCRMSADANLKDGGKTALGLNAGILYMLLMPYILVGCIGVWWYRNRHKNQVVDQSPDQI